MNVVNNAVASLTNVTTAMPAGDFYGTATIGQIDYTRTMGTFCSTCNCYWTGIHTCFTPWYPIYWAPPQVDKMQVAFKLVKHLISKDMVKLDKIEDFIALVDEIVTMI